MSVPLLIEVREMLLVLLQVLAAACGLGFWATLLDFATSYPSSVEAISAVFQVFATLAIAVVGAAWTIHNYKRTRQRQPVVNMEHRIFHKEIVDTTQGEERSMLTFWKRKPATNKPEPLNAYLLRVNLIVSNDGPVVIEGFSGEVVVYVIKPWQPELLDAVRRWRDAQEQDIKGSHTLA